MFLHESVSNIIFRTYVHKAIQPKLTPCSSNPLCIEGKQNAPHLKNVRVGLIDPDTPKSVMTRKSADGSTQNLVVSRIPDALGSGTLRMLLVFG